MGVIIRTCTLICDCTLHFFNIKPWRVLVKCEHKLLIQRRVCPQPYPLQLTTTTVISKETCPSFLNLCLFWKAKIYCFVTHTTIFSLLMSLVYVVVVYVAKNILILKEELKSHNYNQRNVCFHWVSVILISFCILSHIMYLSGYVEFADVFYHVFVYCLIMLTTVMLKYWSDVRPLYCGFWVITTDWNI